MPFGSFGLQRLIAAYRAFAAGPSDCQLHGHDGNAHQNQEQQIENHKYAAAVGAGHIREFPDIADPDRASGADQNETES